MSYQYTKFEENPCVGTDESTPLLNKLGEKTLNAHFTDHLITFSHRV